MHEAEGAVIKCKEIVQAGSAYLMRFHCPQCGEEQFEGFPIKACGDCRAILQDKPVDLSGRRRTLAGSTRKRGKIAKRLVQAMFAQQVGMCAYCSRSLLDGYHVEHIIPVCVGGSNRPDNLVLSCAPCNLYAGSKAFGTFSAKQRYILETRTGRRNAK